MKKIIKLTESELNKIIKRVIAEQDLDSTDVRNQIQADLEKQENPPVTPAKKVEPYNPKTPNAQTTEIQKYLIALGMNVGPTGADGYMGPETIKGIQDFQKSIGKAPSGKLDLDQYKILQQKAREQGNQSLNTPDVATLQRYLNAFKPANDPVWPQLKPDGLRGPLTKKAIMAFQKQSNLPVNGYFDPATVAKLTAAFAGKGSQTTPQPVVKPKDQYSRMANASSWMDKNIRSKLR